MRINETKRRLKRGEVVAGVALQQLRSTELPRLLGAAGFDYIFIDAEHGGFNLETMQDMVKAAVQAGITPFIRVAELHYSLVARALDIGAQGIIMPRVEDPELLRTAIGWTRFPPLGTRGFGITASQISYRSASMVEIMDYANRETMNIVQFESVEALERSDELLAVAGIDVAMIGPADLSISMGVPGEFDHPRLIGAIERFIGDCQRHGVIPGIHCRSTEMAKPWIAKGMKLVGCGSEITMLIERAQSMIVELGISRPDIG
jgi:2-keto-3-deoxy-L-rhamnonate aldolase RhmA